MRISLVTPSFNQAKFLETTLLSVLDQNYPDLEYIVIDGGSTDGSADIIRRHQSRLSYWCSEPDEGQSHAIAKGFARSSGEIIGWLNSDDVLLPDSLREVASYFESHPTDEVLSAGAYYIDPSGRPIVRSAGMFSLGCRATYDRFRFYEQDGVMQPATFWRRSSYVAAGGVDPDLRFIMDRDLFTRLAARRPFGRLPKFLACFRIHEAAKTALLQDVRRREMEDFCSRYGVAQLSASAKALLYWRYRIPSLLKKAYLNLLRVLGVIRLSPFPSLPAPPIDPESGRA